ncbi:TerD family protein [Streptomyces antimicrobicus]|uniref:TerD family protein n=1 Tax=Streptomyces antimicrobicus TaxID=2883108 RepID=A0ABS8BDZ2_9ACTN|nr:TerD family protein [Streptomyces antimicrobicus]MCB5182816.1 TerD family protein [Streptomyces antimicrobicus]
MTGISKGLARVEVALRWDPSPAGTPAHDLDLVAAVYPVDDAYGTPAYVVHFGRRSPDGTVTLDRDSRTGQGFGFDEVMTLELDRMDPALGRVVVGVVIQDEDRRKSFGDVGGTAVRIRAGHDELATDDLTGVAGAGAAVVAEFTREESGVWVLRPGVRGFDAGPQEFVELMGAAASDRAAGAS